MLNFFKKKSQSNYPSLNLKVTDLKIGYIFDYELSQWKVTEEYTYDWGDHYFTKEFKIFDGDQTLFLSVEEDDQLEISIFKKIKTSALKEDIEEEIIHNKRPPKEIHFEDTVFIREEESPGYFNNGNGHWIEFINWDYYNTAETKLLNIEQWGEREFEASIGHILQPHEISNITPTT